MPTLFWEVVENNNISEIFVKKGRLLMNLRGMREFMVFTQSILNGVVDPTNKQQLPVSFRIFPCFFFSNFIEHRSYGKLSKD